MSAIIDGKALAEEIKQKIAEGILKNNIVPVLAVVLVGNNEASHIYVKNKKKTAAEVGMDCRVFELPESSVQKEIEALVDKLNNDKNINGIIVQLPLPRGIDANNIISLISPEKDVDGLGVYNAGRLAMGEPNIVAATPKGILYMLKSAAGDLTGKNAVVVGRSNIVGRPVSSLLLNSDCTVTIAHSKTKNLQEVAKAADIIIAACGCPKIIKKDWVKKGAIVIDVGINRIDGKISGDVDFDEVKDIASYISPVPGGVGPMTVAMLIDNTYNACLKQLGK
ncbi:MAG: bifunctional 5,10-methylenetetrahydrofolate dehydrogenase/5,10-methenyltetrahydrofolate cyclohydrolase [Lactobacillaceae bacterium]|jgi:methylenetetrahydrofolate dehydrogenase (NADP+)/methenyltetrahydrofolate cyclohydrolase|nr:bifunctional 5,10-methylenetetrahydrofolate dehydrogenase/5,10-methenyltetrahydrofolate cyclohydrolase [Lactobacillaceae bacterium]